MLAPVAAPVLARARAIPLAIPLIVLLVAASAAGCGAPPAVRTAQDLLRRGDYAGAEAAADDAFQTHPDHPALWRVKVQAAFGRGHAGRGVALYARWHQRRGSHDPALLRRLGLTTLWQGLRVPSAQVRTRAIQAIERLELEPLARDVAARIGDDDDLVAAAAAVALLRSEPGAPEVARQLLGSDDAAARAVVVEGIGRKLGAAATADLARALGDAQAQVRRAAAAALGAAGEDALAGAVGARVAEMARADQDGPVRAAALRALARLPRAAAPVSLHDLARQALGDPYPGVRLAAIDILARAGDLAPLRSLIASATAAEDMAAAVHAAAAVAEHAGDPALLVAVVERALAHPAPAVRQTGLNAAHKLSDRARATRLATAALDDPTWPVRLAAARALLYLDEAGQRADGGAGSAVGVLVRALDRADERQRVTAAADLLRLGDTRGAQALMVLSASRDPDIREAVVRAHVPRGRDAADSGITDALVAALADESALVRILAAETVLTLLR